MIDDDDNVARYDDDGDRAGSGSDSDIEKQSKKVTKELLNFFLWLMDWWMDWLIDWLIDQVEKKKVDEDDPDQEQVPETRIDVEVPKIKTDLGIFVFTF